MNKRTSLSADLITSCGMNCGICIAYMWGKANCHTSDAQKSVHCEHCKIVECAHLKNTSTGLCVDCVKFPCARINQLEKRYQTHYGISIIQSLETIKTHGMDIFLAREKAHWTCTQCGGTICIYRGVCIQCGEIQFAS
jgi:hypothetical protein